MHLRSGKDPVTAESSDREILDAIDAAVEHRLYWRKGDWPKKGSNNTKSWVKPGDIGYSTHGDPSLLKRLRKMVKAGLLEERHGQMSYVRPHNARFADEGFNRPMSPRFRVIRT